MSDVQEYKRKQIEEQRQAERLQRQLQQERAYLVSLQQQQQQQQEVSPRPPQDKKQLYHYKDQAPGSNDKPAWAKEVRPSTPAGEDCVFRAFRRSFSLLTPVQPQQQRLPAGLLLPR